MLAKILSLTAIALFVFNCSKPKPEPEPTPPPPAPVEEVEEVAPEPTGPSEAELLAQKVQELLNKLLGNKVYFDFDKSELKPEAKEILSEVGSIMQSGEAGRSIQVRIAGHTDQVGTEDYNLALGERRAKMVMEYLEGYGVEASRLNIVSYGEEQPASEEDSQNRRAEFTATTSIQ